jgi:hypothetical protein
MKPRTIWLPADAELPVHVKRQLQAKAHTDHFLGNSRDRTLLLAPKDSTLDSPFFCEEVLSPLVQQMQPNSKKTRKPLTLIRIDHARVHMARATQEKLEVSPFKRMPQPHIAQILHNSTFVRLTENPA